MREPLVQTAPLLTRINVTPIIDVALVLVIILLITAPMLAVADLNVDLPVARSQDLEKTADVSITMAADGQIAVDDVILSGLDQLVPWLQQKIESLGTDDLAVVIRADAGLLHGQVQPVLDAARAAGATHLGLAARHSQETQP